MPKSGLTWINPDSHICCDIFSNPYKYGYKNKSKGQIHRIVSLKWLEIYLCFPKSEQYGYDYNIP